MRMVAALKSRSSAKILYHSCGSVYALIGDLIEIGIDALNPIQVSARNMDPSKLKTEFGDRVAFWGAIDTQKILPFGTPETVREEVRRIIDTLGKGGGYILASVHNIQRKVPPENICAMFDEGKHYGRYRRAHGAESKA
jgi:uroporphyrinogen decarboxylase